MGEALRPHLVPAAIVTAILVPVNVYATTSWTASASPSPIDYSLFGPAGDAILTGHLSQVYALASVQAGPLELLPYGIPQLLGVHSALGWTIFYSVFLAILTFSFVFGMLYARGVAPRTWSWYLAMVVTSMGVLGWFLPRSVLLGHPAEIVVPLLWVVAARCAQDRHFVATGILIAVATGWEVWGLLGIPVILIATRPNILRAAIAGTVGLLVLYLPFVASGTFQMFGFAWPISGETIYHVIAPGLQHFPWSLRLLQAAVSVAAGCLVALLTRRTPYAIWLTPLAIIAFRLALDPVMFEYYWIEPATVAIGMAASMVQWRLWIGAIFAASLVAVTSIAQYTNQWGALALAVLTIGFAVLAHKLDLSAILPGGFRPVLDRKGAEAPPQ